MQLIIDQEFKNLIPPLSEQEMAGLEESLVNDGCRDALVVWGGTLVDGHNRYEICTRLNIPFNTVEMYFENSEEVCDWIDKNQLSRRNLTPDQTRMLRGRRYIRTKKAVNDGGLGTPKTTDGQNVQRLSTAASIANDCGVNEKTIRRDGVAVALLEQHPEKAETIIKGKAKLSDVIRDIKREEYQEKIQQIQESKAQEKEQDEEQAPSLPPSLILADPPWRYDFSETKGREIENHYDTATIDDICNHSPVTAANCILLLWATAPKLIEAIRVMAAWGFQYKTSAVWDKEKIGMGYWFRGQHELLLVGTKGNVSPPSEFARVSSVSREARGNHSAKPDCVYEWIEKAFIEEIKLEMYCRTPRSGWSVWGNEI